jgi:hypothetical protein
MNIIDSTSTVRQKPRQPIIRPGQREPYTKATHKEIEQRLKAAALFDLLEWEKPEVHWFFGEVFGIESRQIDRYRARARHTHEELYSAE